MNPIDELTAALPAAPAQQELPHREQRKAELLAMIANRAGAGARPGRHPAPARARPYWLAPSGRATAAGAVVLAVAIVAVLAVALPRLVHSGSAGGGPASGGNPGVTRTGAPTASGTRLTVARHWTVPAAQFSQVAVSTTLGSVDVTGAAHGSQTVVSGIGGTAKVVQKSGAVASITASPSYHGSPPVISARISAGILTVSATCPRQESCRVDVRVTVPPQDSVRASSGLGNVAVSGLSASVTATSGLGNVSVHAITGNVTARAGQGNVIASGLTGRIVASSGQGDVTLSRIGGLVSAHTGQGTVAATGLAVSQATLTTGQDNVIGTFTTPPDVVVATTSMGSVTLRLPVSVTYAVTARADMGSRSVTVPQSPGSQHRIRATSQMGSVTVGGSG